MDTREKQFCGSSTLRWDLKNIKRVTICYMHILTYKQKDRAETWMRIKADISVMTAN
jgi:hypothetical protein